MNGYLTGGLLAALVVVQPPGVSAQSAKSPATARQSGEGEGGKEALKEVRLNGCISRDGIRPGQFNFLDNDSGDKYRLTGKNLKKFVGQRVEVVGGPPGRGVTFKTGLWPSPNVAAQAGAMDPAQAAVARMPGGAADAPGASPLPEFHVVRLHGVEGGCQ
jgi:hypothetical protein